MSFLRKESWPIYHIYNHWSISDIQWLIENIILNNYDDTDDNSTGYR